jgi:hypothetical protein
MSIFKTEVIQAVLENTERYFHWYEDPEENPENRV